MIILSVDDSKTIRQTIQNIVEVLGADFLEAENGFQAIDILERENGKIDLILLDWEMPEMNGFEFLNFVKKNKKYRTIPVIMLTTISQKEKIIDAIRAGAKQYIIKPFSPEDLLTKMVQTLGIENLDELP